MFINHDHLRTPSRTPPVCTAGRHGHGRSRSWCVFNFFRMARNVHEDLLVESKGRDDAHGIPSPCRVCSRSARLPCGRRGVASRIRARGDAEPSIAASGKGGPRPGGARPEKCLSRPDSCRRVGDAARGATGGTAAGCVWLRSVCGAQILKSDLLNSQKVTSTKCTDELIFVNLCQVPRDALALAQAQIFLKSTAHVCIYNL